MVRVPTYACPWACVTRCFAVMSGVPHPIRVPATDFVLRHLDMMLRLIAGGLPQAGGGSGATGDDLAGLALSARGFECLSLLIGGGPDEHAASPSIAG